LLLSVNDRDWARDLHPKVASLLYGLILGFGVFTRIPTGVFYALLIWIATRGDARFGALAFSLVGLGRALPLIVLAKATTNADQARRWSAVLQRWLPVVRMVNALVLAGAAGWILAAAIAV
jgi:cytochrome c biogenesis protein CcdA